MRKYTMMLAVALGLGFATGVTAQDEKKARQPGQGRGGMTGGGFAINVYSLVGTNKALIEELKITDDQKTKLEEVSKANRSKMEEARKGFTRDATEEQRKEFGEKMAKVNEEAKKAVLEVLNSDQKKRAEQISYQAMGSRAFSDKAVETALKVTDEQKEKIKTISETAQKDSRELMGAGGFRPGGGAPSEEDRKKMEDTMKKVQAIRKEAEEKTVAVLSDDQKKQWKEMIGEKFDTTKLTQGFGDRRRDN